MNNHSGRLLLAGAVTAMLALAGFASPAMSKCVKTHPIFGFDTIVDDKFCQKKTIKKKIVKRKATNAVKKASANSGQPEKAAPVIAAKPDSKIKEMQSLLTSMGYNPGPIDGYNGPQTQKAAREFNIANELPKKAATPSTIAVLRGLSGKYPSPEIAMPIAAPPQQVAKMEAPAPAIAPTPAPAPASDHRIRKMQRLLSSMGYNPGRVDGIDSPATRKAAAEFNIANDLPKKAATPSTIAVLMGLRGRP